MSKVKVTDLKLGDVIRVFEGAFGDAIIIKIDGDSITAFRPYGTTSDFSTTDGLIPYTGIENIPYSRQDIREVELLGRKERIK